VDPGFASGRAPTKKRAASKLDPGFASGRAPTKKDDRMAKAYWVSVYSKINDPEKLAAYAKLAGPALTGAGGKFLARGEPAHVYEKGIKQRTVLIEFESVAAAMAAHDSPAYTEALRALGNGADREIRIMEGV
jgi:uncharacterized protein (DUF1330 family)